MSGAGCSGEPEGELLADVCCLPVGHCIFQYRSLCSLDLSVQTRRARWKWPEPYRFAHKTALNLLSEEFGAVGWVTVGLWATQSVVHQIHSLLDQVKGRL